MPGAEVSTGCFTPALLLNCTGRQQMNTEHQQQPLICKCYNYIHRWHTPQLDGSTVYKYICVCSDVCMVWMSTAALLIIFIFGSIVRYIRELPYIQYVWCIYIHRYTCVVVCVHGVWGEGWGVSTVLIPTTETAYTHRAPPSHPVPPPKLALVTNLICLLAKGLQLLQQLVCPLCAGLGGGCSQTDFCRFSQRLQDSIGVFPEGVHLGRRECYITASTVGHIRTYVLYMIAVL